MMQIDVTTSISRDNNLLFASVDSELVIFQISKSAYFALDQVGTDIWHRLEEPVTVSVLCDALADEYDADRADIERDVLALLNEMYVADLIILQQP